MLHIVLYEPEIPPNTGNVIRLCANTGAQLHLIRPMGFDLEHAKLRRAGLDYHEYASIQMHDSFALFQVNAKPTRVFALSTRGSTLYTNPTFMSGDALLFGPETRGLPQALLESVPETQRLRLPMLPHNRSLNLSNAVAVVVFEAWRQLGFVGAS